MGIIKRFFNQTRKPEGFLGSLMLRGMNSGHAVLADWALSHLPQITPEKTACFGMAWMIMISRQICLQT